MDSGSRIACGQAMLHVFVNLRLIDFREEIAKRLAQQIDRLTMITCRHISDYEEGKQLRVQTILTDLATSFLLAVNVLPVVFLKISRALLTAVKKKLFLDAWRVAFRPNRNGLTSETNL